MRYQTSIERLAKKEGHEEGMREAMLEVIAVDWAEKFGQRGRRLLQKSTCR